VHRWPSREIKAAVPNAIQLYGLFGSRLHELNQAFPVMAVRCVAFGVLLAIIKPGPVSILEDDVWEIATATRRGADVLHVWFGKVRDDGTLAFGQRSNG
jgi:hypothetical protein